MNDNNTRSEKVKLALQDATDRLFDDPETVRKYQEYVTTTKQLLSDLQEAGCEYPNIFWINNPKFPKNTKAIPVLIDHLQKEYSWNIKLILMASLKMHKVDSVATNVVIQLLKSDPDQVHKWHYADYLSDTADDKYFAEIMNLITDQSNGRSRERLLVALIRMKNHRQEVIKYTYSLIGEKGLTGHAIDALRKMEVVGAIPIIEKYIDDKDYYIRQNVKKAIKYLLNKLN